MPSWRSPAQCLSWTPAWTQRPCFLACLLLGCCLDSRLLLLVEGLHVHHVLLHVVLHEHLLLLRHHVLLPGHLRNPYRSILESLPMQSLGAHAKTEQQQGG